MSYTQWKKKNLRERENAGETVQAWAKESSALIGNTQTSVDSWFDQTQYEAQTGALSNMITQADSWRTLYAGDARMLESIDSVVNALKGAQDHVTGYYDYYSLWDSAEAYNTAKQNSLWEQNYQAESYDTLTEILATMEEGAQKQWLSAYIPLIKTQADYDNEIAKLQAQIEEMEAFYDRAYTIESWYTDYSTSAKGSRTDLQTDAENLQIYNELVEKYGTLEELDALIQQNKLRIKQTERDKEHSRLFSVMNPYSENYDPEFATKSAYVSTSDQSTDLGYYDVPYEDFYGQSNGQSGAGLMDITYEYVNGNEDVIALYADKSLNYHYMNEDEVALYNYYYATEGKTAADHYLDMIQETLNLRAAEGRYEDYEGNTFKEILFGLEAGWDQFKSGVGNFFNFSDDYIPVSETQMLAGMVRDDLADDSIPMWYNMKTGKWEEKVFGNSAGQLAFDAVNTTANMLPSVLTSAAINLVAPGVGSVVGAGITGISAAGNAYQEMLNLGYDTGQARAYSTLVGAAETGLSYAISGVSKLGGEISNHWMRNALSSVDNAFARVALKLGGNMVSEGVEEALTEVMTPMFKNMTLKTNEEVDWGQVAYSGLMGAITANLFEGSGVIAENAEYYKTGKTLQAAGISADQLAEAGKFSAEETVRQLAARVDENTGAYTLGRLFYEMGAVLTEADKAAIVAALETQGVRNGDAKTMTQAFAAVMGDASLTDQQAQMLEANDVLAQTVMQVFNADSNTLPLDAVEIGAFDPTEEGLVRNFTPDGSVFKMNTNEVEPTPNGGDTENGALAMSNSAASNNSISETAAGEADMEEHRSPFAWLKTEQAVLQQAIDSMDPRPMNPKVYKELKAYSKQLQHMDTTQRLLAQKQNILQQQQAEGATLSQIRQTQTDTDKLEKMLTDQQKKLQKNRRSPALQKVIEKTRAEMNTQTVENSRKNGLDISKILDRIKTEGNIITDGSHLQNGKLKPNVTYQTGEHEYIYQTNDDGLICKVYVEELGQKIHDGRLPHDRDTEGKLPGDHAGHLIGDQYGGSPGKDNVISQAATVNLSEYKKIENQWKKAQRDGKKVSVEISVNYDSGGVRPSSFTVEYTIEDEYTIKTIYNK